MSASSRDFQKAAAQRFTRAEFLLDHRFNLDAMYLLGYTIECSLKALILYVTTPADQLSMLAKLRSGAMHNPEVLVGILKELGTPVPMELVKRFRRSGWSVALRYESGRTDTGETRAFLKTAKLAYDWVEGQLP